LIATHGTLDKLIEAAPTIAQKRYREGLLSHADDARMSRELARIRTNVPVTFDAEALRFKGPSPDRCFKLFSALGFRTLVTEYAPTAVSSTRKYRVATSLAEVETLAAALGSATSIGIAAISQDTSAVRADILGWAFASAPGEAVYLPFAHSGLSDTPNLPASDVFALLSPVLSNPAIGKIGHDLKFVSIAAARHGVEIGGETFDTMIGSYLVDATRSSHEIGGLALERLNYRAVSEDTITGKGVKAVAFDAVPAESLAVFAGERADLPLSLADDLRAELDRERLRSVYDELEAPLVPVLADIERAGVRVDTDTLAALSGRMEGDLSALCAKIYALAGEEFNINSPKQLADVLFVKLNLTAGKKTGKTRVVSTAQDVLEELAQTHELPGLVLKWRSIQKLKGTYVDALPSLVSPVTGRVHTTFNQAVAATGRLSSSDPNLQNIPIRTPLGREIRAAFAAAPGHVLISADYSQIELRVLAHLSKDAALADAFTEGLDIHDRTAERVFGANSGLDAHELRRRAKIINYALLYGKTAFTLAKDIGVTQQAAQEFIDAYFAGFPGVRTYIDQTLETARQTGVVRTITGRRRLVPEITSKNGMIRMAAERESVNMPIQGTAADVLKRAMIAVHAALNRHNAGRPIPARMILTVHDELLFEAPEQDADAVSDLVREHMEQAFPLDVPLTVDVGVGHNWKEAKP
jgi:DNA polymerase-1